MPNLGGMESAYGTATPSATDSPNIQAEYAELLSLHTARCADFDLVKVVAHGSQGSVFCVRCSMENLPACCVNKLYALKVFYHFRKSDNDTVDSFRRARENEWHVLAKALRHPNIIRIWTCFEDTIGDTLWNELPENARDAILTRGGSGGENGRRLAQFVVFDHYEQSIREALTQPSLQPLPYSLAKKWFMQLLEVARYLKSKYIVHCDMKLEHLLLSANKDLVVTGFSCAKHLREHFFFPYSTDASPGGSEANIAPEVLNEFETLRKEPHMQHHAVDFGHQTDWATGVIVYEAIAGRRPLANYPAAFMGDDSRVTYTAEDLAPLPASYGEEFDSTVRGLLHPDPLKRLDVDEAMQRLCAIPDGSIHARLDEMQRQLTDEREKRRKAEQERDELNELKNNLVQERVRLVKERKEDARQMEELRRQYDDLERRYNESTTDGGRRATSGTPTGESSDSMDSLRHANLDQRFEALRRDHSDAVEELDRVVEQRDAFALRVSEMGDQVREATSSLAEVARQRDQAFADRSRLEQDVAGEMVLMFIVHICEHHAACL